MSLASVIGTMRKRIQQLEREVGRLSRRLGEEIPPEWEAMKLAINPLCMNYTPIVPLLFGSASCARATIIAGELVADPLNTQTYTYSLFPPGSEFRPFAGARGWGIPNGNGMLVLWHDGMGFMARLTGCLGQDSNPHLGTTSWVYKWYSDSPAVTWETMSLIPQPAILLNSQYIDGEVHYRWCKVQDWAVDRPYVLLHHTPAGFVFTSHVNPTYSREHLSGEIPGTPWWPVIGEEEE